MFESHSHVNFALLLDVLKLISKSYQSLFECTLDWEWCIQSHTMNTEQVTCLDMTSRLTCVSFPSSVYFIYYVQCYFSIFVVSSELIVTSQELKPVALCSLLWHLYLQKYTESILSKVFVKMEGLSAVSPLCKFWSLSLLSLYLSPSPSLSLSLSLSLSPSLSLAPIHKRSVWK